MKALRVKHEERQRDTGGALACRRASRKDAASPRGGGAGRCVSVGRVRRWI